MSVKRGSGHLVMAQGLLQLVGKEAGEKESILGGGFRAQVSLPRPSGLSAVSNHSGLSAHAPLLWGSRARRNPSPQNLRVPEGFLGGLSATSRDAGHFRGQGAPTGGTEAQDCRPGLETASVLFHLQLCPHLIYTLHEAFLGEGRKSHSDPCLKTHWWKVPGTTGGKRTSYWR